MKISVKILLIIILLAIVPLTLAGTAAYIFGNISIRNTITESLISTNLLKKAELDTWIEGSKIMLRSIVRRSSLKNDLDILVSEDIDTDDYQAAIEDINQEVFQPLIEEGRYIELFLLNPSDGKILAHSNKENIGKYKVNEDYFSEGKKDTFVQNPYFKIGTDDVLMTVSTPVTGGDGNLLAVLCGNLDLDKMEQIIGRQSGLFESMETYLVNSFYFFVTSPRTEVEKMRRAIHTEGVKKGIAGKNGVGFYEDYLGVPVIGAYNWLPDWDMVLISEIDQKEALGPIYMLRNILLGVCGSILVIGIATGIHFSRSITRPLGKLAKGAEEYGKGNLDYEIKIKTKDELGQFAAAFNEMSERWKSAEQERIKAHLQMVASQTAERIFEYIPDPVVVIDMDGRITRYNRATKDILGYGKDIIGKSPEVLVAKEERQKLNGLIREVKKEGFSKNRDFNFITKKKGKIPVMVNGSLWIDAKGKPMGTIGVIRDITELKKAENNLKRRTAELKSSNIELENFAYVASHDLQEPLRVISNFSSLLSKRYKNKLDGEANEFIDFIVNGASRMQDLIKDLLSYSRISTRGNPLKVLILERLLKSLY